EIWLEVEWRHRNSRSGKAPDQLRRAIFRFREADLKVPGAGSSCQSLRIIQSRVRSGRAAHGVIVADSNGLLAAVDPYLSDAIYAFFDVLIVKPLPVARPAGASACDLHIPQ